MAIALRASTGNFGFGTVVCNKPTGTVAQDVMYALISNRTGTATPTSPGGWTVVTSWDTNGRQRLFRRVCDGSEGSTFTFSAGSDTLNGIIWTLSGVDNTTPEDATPPSSTASFSSTTVNAPSITTVTANAMVIHMFGSQFDSTSMSAPGDTLIRYYGSCGALYNIQAVAGASGTKTITLSQAANWNAATIAVRPASGVDPVPGAPDPTTGVSEIHDANSVSLTWTNPSTSDFSGTLIRRATGSTPPATASDGTLVSDVAAPGASATDSGLTAATTYSYSLFAHDGSGNYAAAASVTVTTNTASGAPSAVTGLVHSESANACSLSWTNPVGGSFTGAMVRRATGSVPPANASSGTLISDVASPGTRATDTGLNASTTYSYAVFSHDAYGNYAAAATATITTLASGVAPAAGSRPASPRPGGLQRVTNGIWVPSGKTGSKQGERSGYVPGPSVFSRAPHMRNFSFFTDFVSQTFRVSHLVMCPATEIRFVYGNYEQSPTGNDITVRAGLELSGSYFLPVTFNGQRDVVIPSNTHAISDPIPIDLVEGQRVWSRTRVTVTSGQKIPSNIIYSDSANGEGRDTSGNDLTTSGSISAAGFQALYGPCYVAGTPAVSARPVPMVALIGDSIMASEAPVSAYEARMTNAHIPHVNMARSGEKATFDFDRTGRQTRLKLLNQCTHAIVEYGINDLSIYTGAQIKAGLYDVWRMLSIRGIKVYQTTITPSTTSTDGFTTLAGQTTQSFEAARLDLNAWIRAGAPVNPANGVAVAIGTPGALVAGQPLHPLAGYLDIAATVESTTDPGKWVLNAATTDGLHPGASGHNLMQSAIDLTKFAPAAS